MKGTKALISRRLLDAHPWTHKVQSVTKLGKWRLQFNSCENEFGYMLYVWEPRSHPLLTPPAFMCPPAPSSGLMSFMSFSYTKKSAVSKTKSLWFENKWPALRFLKSQQSNKTKRGVWEHRELSVGFGNTMHFCLHFPGESRAMQVFTNAFTS